MKKILLMFVPLFIFLMCMLNGTDASADLVLRDDNIWGPGTIIHDTSTGLYWLKPSKTVNLSYNTISEQLGSGAYTGFRYASSTEVQNLFITAGLPIGAFYDGIAYGTIYNRMVALKIFGVIMLPV